MTCNIEFHLLCVDFKRIQCLHKRSPLINQEDIHKSMGRVTIISTHLVIKLCEQNHHHPFLRFLNTIWHCFLVSIHIHIFCCIVALSHFTIKLIYITCPYLPFMFSHGQCSYMCNVSCLVLDISLRREQSCKWNYRDDYV